MEEGVADHDSLEGPNTGQHLLVTGMPAKIPPYTPRRHAVGDEVRIAVVGVSTPATHRGRRMTPATEPEKRNGKSPRTAMGRFILG